jgi:hypothetical protein
VRKPLGSGSGDSLARSLTGERFNVPRVAPELFQIKRGERIFVYRFAAGRNWDLLSPLPPDYPSHRPPASPTFLSHWTLVQT